ncbi:MAG: hypothetical protein F4029_17810 [Gammaproteobacteria bacterium]|nr:hypothetical protein [Gammaproteobacteria bacterium]MYF28884.1 hypothetical protein [Gammaproteobacteria bacterium]MYK48074.1 hypothetical protein [Gammaproteobacteria bacterium]
MDSSQGKPVVYPMPSPGTRTRRVWEIADAVTEETGTRAERREVVRQFVAENGNANTANTQYQRWKSAYDARRQRGQHEQTARSTPNGRAGDVAAQPLRVGSDGRVVIPHDMRAAMLLNEDGHVTARVVRGELRLISRPAAIERMQTETATLKKPGESVVDEFLSERRALWGEERGEE